LTEEEKKERIRYYADWTRSLWLGVLGLSGSLAGLWLNLDSRSKFLLFVAGVIVDFLLGAWITLLHRRIERLMTTLGREGL
jgi:hypothetical protein